MWVRYEEKAGPEELFGLSPGVHQGVEEDEANGGSAEEEQL